MLDAVTRLRKGKKRRKGPSRSHPGSLYADVTELELEGELANLQSYELKKSIHFHDYRRAAMNLDARIDRFSISRGFSYM